MGSCIVCNFFSNYKTQVSTDSKGVEVIVGCSSDCKEQQHVVKDKEKMFTFQILNSDYLQIPSADPVLVLSFFFFKICIPRCLEFIRIISTSNIVKNGNAVALKNCASDLL